MAASEAEREAGMRRIFLTIWRHATSGMEPGEQVVARGTRALTLAMDEAAAIGKRKALGALDAVARLQLERDCAAICARCRGVPDAPDEYVRPAAIDPKRRAAPLRGIWRHEWGIKGSKPIGTLQCLAAPIRVAWAAEHPEESTNGAD